MEDNKKEAFEEIIDNMIMWGRRNARPYIRRLSLMACGSAESVFWKGYSIMEYGEKWRYL